MADQKYKITFNVPPPPPPPESLTHAGFRILTDPLAKTLGVQKAVEDLGHPTLADATSPEDTNTIDNPSLIRRLLGAVPGAGPLLARIPETKAEWKGLASGAGGTVTPAHVLSAMTLPASAGEGAFAAASPIVRQTMNAANVVGSGGMAAKGGYQLSQDVMDPKASKVDVARDLFDVGSGLLGAYTGSKAFLNTRNAVGAAKAAASTPKSVLDNQLAGLKTDIESKQPFTDEILANKYPELHAETVKRPGGKYSMAIWGDEGRPSELPLAEKANKIIKDKVAAAKAESLASQMNNKDAAGDLADQIAQQKEAQQAATDQVKQLNEGFKANADANKGLAKAQDVATKVVGKAQDQAAAENIKRTNEAVAQANAEAQQNRIDDFLNREDVVKSEPSVVQTVKGKGPIGEAQSMAQRISIKPPKTSEGEIGDIGGGEGPIGGSPSPQYSADKLPTRDTAATTIYTSKKLAYDHARGLGADDVMRVPGGYRVIFKDIEPPEAPPASPVPTTPKPTPNAPAGSVAKAIEKNKPFNQLSSDEQNALTPLLTKAMNEGYSGDIEDLGNELAGRLQAVKESRQLANSAGTAQGALTAAVRKLGGLKPNKNDAGELAWLKEHYGVTRGSRSGRGLFNSTKGLNPDDLVTRLTQEGKFPQVTDPNTLIQELAKEARNASPTQQSALDELTGSLSKGWWKKTNLPRGVNDIGPDTLDELEGPVMPPNGGNAVGGTIPKGVDVNDVLDELGTPTKGNGEGPPLTVEEFAKKLSDEGSKPVVPIKKMPSGKIKGSNLPPSEVQASLLGDKPTTPDNLFEQAAQPEVPTTPSAAAPIRFFKSPLEAAGQGYGDIKAAKAAGEAVPEEGRAIAGKVASRLNRLARAKTPQVEEVPPVGPDVTPTTKRFIEGPTSDDLANMPEGPEKDSLLREMVKRFMSESGKLKGESGASNLAMMGRLASGAAGGTIGYDQDPLGNKPLSAMAGAGAGFFAPEIYRGGVRGLSALKTAGSPYGDASLDFMNKLHNTSLLSPLSVAKKAAGDVGGLGLASIEHIDRAPDILRQFLTSEGRSNIAQNFREGFTGPDQEAISGLENFVQKGPLSWMGRSMGGLTKATKGILGEAGFTPAEQKYYTLTASPSHNLTKYLYAALRGGGTKTDKGSKIIQHLAPFAKIGINRLERGWEYSPFGLLSKTKDADQIGNEVKKALLGTAVAGAAYKATPDNFVKEHPTKASVIASLGGPLGLPILAAMAAKNAHLGNTKLNVFNPSPDEGTRDALLKMSDATGEIARDIPGLRLIEDITGRSFPVGFARNYLSGYTNNVRPIALLTNPEEPDISSKNLSLSSKLLNRMISNIPGSLKIGDVPLGRGALPRKEISLTTKPKFKITF